MVQEMVQKMVQEMVQKIVQSMFYPMPLNLTNTFCLLQIDNSYAIEFRFSLSWRLEWQFLSWETLYTIPLMMK